MITFPHLIVSVLSRWGLVYRIARRKFSRIPTSDWASRLGQALKNGHECSGGVALRSRLYDRRYVFLCFSHPTNPCLRTYVGACRTAGSVVVKPGDRCETFSNGPAGAHQPVWRLINLRCRNILRAESYRAFITCKSSNLGHPYAYNSP